MTVGFGMKESKEEAVAGLCASCLFMRRIVSDRGSVFYFCERSVKQAEFPKYPRLPVRACAGFENSTQYLVPRKIQTQIPRRFATSEADEASAPHKTASEYLREFGQEAVSVFGVFDGELGFVDDRVVIEINFSLIVGEEEFGGGPISLG